MGLPWTLTRIVGAAKARELPVPAGEVRAVEALRLGLVSEVFEAEAYEEGVELIVARLRRPRPRRSRR